MIAISRVLQTQAGASRMNDQTADGTKMLMQVHIVEQKRILTILQVF